MAPITRMGFHILIDIFHDIDSPAGVARPVMRKKSEVLAEVFEKTYFFTKILYTYTMNYLPQEKCLRDHESTPGMTCPL
jgi:hypothetical protein